MERNGVKKVMLSLMLLMMVVVAQRQGQPPPSPSKHCFKECAMSCAPKLKPKPIAICFSICMLKCEIQPPPAVYNCIGICAKSIVDANPQADAKTMQRYVDSCYGSCKNNL